jgi:membrane-bound serine protease (ClpP class)
VRRLAITLLVAPLLGMAGSALLSPQASAADRSMAEEAAESVAADLAPVDVLQVSGLFDEVVVDSIVDAIDRAEQQGSQALILQLDTKGAVVSRDQMAALLQQVVDARVPVGVWVGPARSARAYGLPAQLLAVADVTAMVAGSRVGFAGVPLNVAGAADGFGPAADALVGGSLSFGEARKQGALKLDTPDQGVPTIRSMVLAMDGVAADGVVLDTVADELNDDGSTQKVSTLVRFNGLGVVDQTMHTVASPPIAYLLFVVGLALLIFEFFTAGVGVAGFVGAFCTILGCYGLSALPTRPLAVAIILVAMVAFAIDVQVGIPRFWTGVGTVLFAIGSIFLFESLPGTTLRPGWFTLVVVISGMALTFVSGMPSMVRTRFATPTIGREWMIGEVGSATTSISPDGVALVSGARWRARSNRATPIPAGAELRVIGIDGVTLDVEPLEGAARDYRERRPKAPATE